MKFTCSIAMDNAAFTEWPEGELVRCLRRVCERIEGGEEYGKVMDINGNSVGKWEIEEE